jgi:hypothetical protein
MGVFFKIDEKYFCFQNNALGYSWRSGVKEDGKQKEKPS